MRAAFQWPVIVGIVAVVLIVLPLSPREAEITACFSFFVGLLNAGPGPILSRLRCRERCLSGNGVMEESRRRGVEHSAAFNRDLSALGLVGFRPQRYHRP